MKKTTVSVIGEVFSAQILENCRATNDKWEELERKQNLLPPYLYYRMVPIKDIHGNESVMIKKFVMYEDIDETNY